MISSSQATLSQSKTIIATETTAPQTGQTVNNNEQTQTHHQEQRQRLVLYNSLFGQDRNKLCDKTGLQFVQSLNCLLHTFLHLNDKYWILSIIDVDEYDNFNEKYGESSVKNKLNQIGTVVKTFCNNNPNKLKGFKCKINDLIIDDSDSDDEIILDHDLYALLLYCYPQLNVSQKYMFKLQKKIKQQTNETVSVGMAKMNEWETFDEWKHRAYKNLKCGKERGILEAQKTNETFFSDIDVKYVNPRQGDEKDEKHQEQQGGVVNKLANKEEFDSKMQEIANNEEYEWIVAIMEIDDFDLFVFNNNNNKEIISKEINKVEKEMFHLFDIFGNNRNEVKYLGYKLNATGGMILYDSKDISKCFVAGHSITETLSSEIRTKCKFSVSIGSSRLIEDDLGMIDDLIQRLNNNLKQAKKNGGNQVCFAINIGTDNPTVDISDVNIKSDQVNMFTNTRDDDLIEEKSLGVIEVCLSISMCCLYSVCVLICLCCNTCVFLKKYGFAAYDDLESVCLIVNNGDLVNENDLDLKCHFDPTESSRFKSISTIKYERIFYEVVAFIEKNNGIRKYGDGKDNSTMKRYFEYPKWCLNGNKPKCSDKEHCKQCHGKHNSDNGIFSLCATIRRQIADKLFDRGQLEKCSSDSLYKTASKLCINNRLLMKESKEYKLNKNWFANVYSFLIWQQEVIHILLHNLVYLSEPKSKLKEFEEMKIGIADADEVIYDEEKDIECATHGSGSMVHQVKESEFLFKFDALTILNSYLDQLIEYLVLYYCCFDSQSWITIFYPFIEYGIGTEQCSVLFSESNKTYTSKASGKKSQFTQILEMDGNIEMKRECVQEIKAICIFKRLLYDVYRRDNDQVNMDIATTSAMKNVQSAFNLANQVCTKLKETINNIKTQLVLREMTTNNSEKDLEQERYNQENKDDWVINDSGGMNQNSISIETPSFIRLFVIRRIIDKHIKTNKDKKEKKITIKEIANVFKENKKIESSVINILTRLINDGIKKYMDKWYNEKAESNIIEDIFEKIILGKFAQEYNEMTKYGINNERNDNYYQFLLFNSSDLMTQIFQYLKWGYNFDQDLYECSLVSSHWLYHAWNINSVYHIDCYKWFQNTDDDRKWTRIWQRLYNAKSIRFSGNLRQIKALATVNKLSMFKKIEKVDVGVFGAAKVDQCISAVIPIMSRCKDRIKHCQMQIGYYGLDLEDFEAPSPLRLPKAQCVEIGDLVFHRVWTNECTRLKLSWVSDINKDWCKFVIENCDCSSITTLTLDWVTFDDNSINDVILKQLALKFDNLKTLEIVTHGGVHDQGSVLLFWQLLKPIISKNKTKVKLIVDDFEDDDVKLFSQRMDEKDLKIDKLIIGDMSNNDDTDGAIKLIQERDNRGLTHLTFRGKISDTRGKKFLDELKCKSITAFELQDKNIYFVNPLLEWKMIAEKQIFVMIDVTEDHSDYDSDEVLSLLKQLYQNVYQLFVEQMALDIKITLNKVEDSKLLYAYLSTYSSYFENKEFLSRYNKPKCNSNLCLPRDKPYTYFYLHDSKKELKTHCVFRATNVQIK